MTWIGAGLVALVLLAGLRRLRARAARPLPGTPRVDDDALRRILATGTLATPDDEPLDLDAAARAEEEFWRESWDEPDEYPH